MEGIMRDAIGGLAADYAEIRVERAESTALAFMGPVLETVGTTSTIGGCVRVCVNGGWGFAAFNRIEDARPSARIAAEMAALAGGDGTMLAPVAPVTATVERGDGIDPSGISLEEKCGLLARYNARMVAEPGIITTNSAYRDTRKTVWLHTSGGTMIRQEKMYAGVHLAAVAKDGANVQRGAKSFGDQRGYGTVLDRDADVEDILKITRDLIRAPKVESGVYPVILDPELAGVFAHEAFGHLSEADFIYENPQAREMMRLGRRFGPEILTIVDDGSLAGENGATVYDDEGVPGRRNVLVREGVLTGRLHSRETAGRMGEEPTGNARAITAAYRPIVRMTTTFIDRGESAFEEMLGKVGNGIYACGFLGGNTDLERFTFSSACAYRIENGKITTPLRDVILSGNVFDTLNQVSLVGNDLTLHGGLGGCGKGDQFPLPVSDGAPHIAIRNVLVG